MNGTTILPKMLVAMNLGFTFTKCQLQNAWWFVDRSFIGFPNSTACG
jgi:hypothetical protein